MFRRVGQGLQRDIIRRRLDRLRQARVRRDVELDGDRRAARERSQSRAETALGKDRRVDPARDLLQFRDRIHQPGRDPGQLDSKVAPVERDIILRGVHRQFERDQPLLHAIVEVSLNPPPNVIRRGDDPPARGGKRQPAVRIRDRGGHEAP